MDSKITINIVEPGSGPTPAPVVPNTGLFTHGIGGPEATAIGTVLILTIAAIVVVFLYRKQKKAGKVTKLVHLVDSTKAVLKSKKRVTAGLSAIALLASAGTLTTLLTSANKNNTNAVEEDGLTLDVSSEDFTIEVGDTPVFAVLPVELTVEEATQAGYTLTAYADSTDLVSTTNPDNIIPMVTLPDSSVETLESSEVAGELSSLTDNTYGLALDEEPTTKDAEVYMPLSTDSSTPTILKATDYVETEANDTTTIYYGFYITPDVPYGTYTGTNINYNAEPHYITNLSFNGNGNDGGVGMESISVLAGGSTTLPANTYTKTGYEFVGWNTSVAGIGQDYADGAEYTAVEGEFAEVTLYAQWKAPVYLYNNVAAMSKGTQTLAQLQETITAPTTTDYTADTSNSGVYEYNSSVFGEASDASSANKIYYYRGVLEPETDQGEYGSDGKATTYPNYVRLSNDTCWRIVRTTSSGGVKMIYNGTWTGSTCANGSSNAQTTAIAFASQGTSSKSDWYRNIHYVGYTLNSRVTDSTANTSVNTVFGSDTNPSLNNTRSNIKTYIEDTWYAGNMTAYTNLLEPAAGYCNDRTAYSDKTTTTVLFTIVPYKTSNAVMYFGTYGRNLNATKAGKTPSLTCPRSTVDLYRYAPNSEGTSNELKYPAALLTVDELSLAGSGSSTASQGSSNNTKSYLRSGSSFWLLSPGNRTSDGGASGFYLLGLPSYLSNSRVDYVNGVRPAISLKPGTTVSGGTGIATDPWIINE